MNRKMFYRKNDNREEINDQKAKTFFWYEH